MTRATFHEQLEALEIDLLSMGELAANSVMAAVEALVSRDDAKAEAVVAADDEIDDLYLKVDRESIDLLALQSPVAGDLRLVSAILHSSLHLERIGDQSVNIAKAARGTSSLPSSDRVLRDIEDMGTRVVEMTRTSMEALRRRDLELCYELQKMDDPVDRLNRNMHLEVAKLADDIDALRWGMHMNLVARALERVGDNAVDIGEQVGFLLTGKFREFTDASGPVGELTDES